MTLLSETLSRGAAEAIQEQILVALRARPDRHTIWLDRPYNLYLDDAQSEAYLSAASSDSYSKTLASPIRDLITTTTTVLLAGLSDHVEFIDLGPARPLYTLPLLMALRDSGVRCRYSPVDISEPLLSLATSEIQRHGFVVSGVHCLFEDLPKVLRRRTQHPLGLRLVNFGATFMNYRPAAAVSLLRQLLRPGDLGLVAADLFASPDAAIAPYLTSEAEAFTFLPLAAVGLAPEEVQYFVRYARSRVEMGFTVLRPRAIGHAMLRTHTDIVTALSYRYTPTSLAGAFQSFASVVLVTSDTGGVALARVSP
jgi:hypothetical protein